MTTTVIEKEKPGFFAVFLGEPFELVKAQPHQALISTGSIALMGQFAGSSGIVDPLVGYCIAAGVEEVNGVPLRVESYIRPNNFWTGE